MKELIRMSPGIPRSGYSVNVDINDVSLLALSVDDIRVECDKRRRTSCPVHVSLTIDNTYDLETYYEFLRKIEKALGENIKIDIYASGRCFNTMMDSISYSDLKEKIVVHIDDHDVLEVMDSANIDLYRIACECEFSKSYIRNLSVSDFELVYRNNMFIFNRDRAIEERKIISEVWRKICPDERKLNRLSSLAKTLLVVDYINSNISYANNGHRIVGEYNGINQHYVEPWASDGVLTYKKKSGVCSGQVELASILLDNYYARTNCYKVSGIYRPMHDLHTWIAVKDNGENYGVCLTLRRRFVDLSKAGYEKHEVMLENEHCNREDYLINLDSYIDVSREKYTAFRSKVYEFLNSGDESVSLPPRRRPRPLPKRKTKVPPLPNRRLPRKVSDD